MSEETEGFSVSAEVLRDYRTPYRRFYAERKVRRNLVKLIILGSLILGCMWFTMEFIHAATTPLITGN